MKFIDSVREVAEQIGDCKIAAACSDVGKNVPGMRYHYSCAKAYTNKRPSNTENSVELDDSNIPDITKKTCNKYRDIILIENKILLMHTLRKEIEAYLITDNTLRATLLA